MSFFQWLRSIIERPAFFTTLEFTRARVWRFYAMLILCFTAASVVIAIPDTIRFARWITSPAWQEQTNVVVGLYPDELEVTIGNGRVSTNVEEPFFIPLPAAWRTGENASLPENLLVIDTTKSIALEDFTLKSTFLILGKDTVGTWDEKTNGAKLYPLRDKLLSGFLVVTRDEYMQFITHASGVVQKVLLIGIFLSPFLLYGTYFFGYLGYLIFGAVLVWLVAKRRGYLLSYSDAYKAGMYFLPIPLVYDFSVMLLNDLPHARVPFLFTVLLIVVAMKNFPPLVPSDSTTVETPSPSPEMKSEDTKGEG